MTRHLYRAAALVGVAAFAVTGCGGDGSDNEADGKIEGAKKEEGQHSPSPSASGDTTVQPNPGFKLPKDVHVKISADKTGDKKKDAILDAQANMLMANQHAYSSLNPQDPYLARYFTGESKSFYGKDVARLKNRGETGTGVYRYFNRKVTTHDSHVAVVKYCGDQSKVTTKHVKSGKKDPLKPSDEDVAYFTSVLQKSPAGDTWQEQSFDSVPGAPQCS